MPYIKFNNTNKPAINDTNLNNMQDMIKQDIDGAVSGDTLPIGSIIPFGSDAIPENWLLCNGAEISRETYAYLFNTLGTRYGDGDGFTTFNIPDLRGKVVTGKETTDTDFDTLGKTGGEKTHKLIVEEMPAHNHTLTNNTLVNRNMAGSGGAQGNNTVAGSTIECKNTGGGQAHNNLQPYTVCNFIIKAKQSSGLVATVVDSLESVSEVDALSAKKGKELKEKIVGTVLYENETGTTGNIELTDSVANYDYIEIQSRRPDFVYSSGRLYNVNGKTVSLSATYTTNIAIYTYAKTVTISEKRINVIRANLGYFDSSSSAFTTDDSNFITRVVGYKIS